MGSALAERKPRPYRALGRRVAQLRRERGITQWELADQVGISHGYPPLIESGQNRPDAAILRRIASILRADYNELAVLAGFLPESEGDVEMKLPREVAPIARRLLAYPAEVWAKLELTAGAWVTGEQGVQPPPNRNAEHGTDQQREQQPPAAGTGELGTEGRITDGQSAHEASS